MSTINKSIVIAKNNSSEDDLNFDFLRKKGIEYIEALGSKYWTDYNTHDPGITMLEVLSYAITDLGMRINLPIEDILSDTSNSLEGQFFKASEILPNNPVTQNDYRKLFIDTKPEIIKNCWLKKYPKKMFVNCKDGKLAYSIDLLGLDPAEYELYAKEIEIKGFYTVLVDVYDALECDADETEVSSFITNNIESLIFEKYHNYRNLCEDLVEVIEVETQKIAVCAEIDIEPEADEELIYAKIQFKLDQYLSPSPHFFSLKQMFEKGYTSDDIFEGPLLEHGFIPEEELNQSTLRTEVRLSDIIAIIMKIDGVKVIKDITLNNCPEDGSTPENVWNICVKENKKPVLCCKSTFNFTKGLLPLTINEEKAEEYLTILKENDAHLLEESSANKEIEIPSGVYTDTSAYTSVTNNFPENYGIGEVGLSEAAGTERKAKAKQLKGYLLFFDQIMASYFKQLNNVKNLLSINSDLTQTYFTQAISDMDGFDEIVTSAYTNAVTELHEDSLFKNLDDKIKRQNQIKDHLIARFAERFSEYAFLMKSIYGSAADEIVLQNKRDFLASYNLTSSQRGSAFNYYNQPLSNLWDTFNVTGLENRIAGLLGIKTETNPATGKKGIQRKNISDLFVEIYDSLPAMPETKFKWRVKNASATTIIEAVNDSDSENAASNKMYYTIVKILEPNNYDPDEILASASLEYKTYKIIEPSSNQFTFQIIDDLDSTQILAQHPTTYATAEEVIVAIEAVISFFKNEFNDEGIFVVEHILLTPEDGTVDEDYFISIEDCECSPECCIPDPYSFKISVVLPGYTYRFSDIDFRNFAEDLIRQEIPAHILGKICWIGYREGFLGDADNDLTRFEIDFKNFLSDKSQGLQTINLFNFTRTLSELNSIYPTGRLFDCSTEEEESGSKIFLGRTNLGTL